MEGWRQAVYYRYWEHDDPEHHAPAHYGVRTPTHKYIRYYNDGLGTPGSSTRIMPVEDELYDLVADPQEMTNVVDDIAYAQILEQLRTLTAQLQAEYGERPLRGAGHPAAGVADGLRTGRARRDTGGSGRPRLFRRRRRRGRRR